MDGEGQLLAMIREQVGPDMPLVASLDMHANITPQMVAHTDALTVFRTYPHLDMVSTGARAFAALDALMKGITLHKFYRHLPYIVPLHAQHTGSPPCDAIYAGVAAIGATPSPWPSHTIQSVSGMSRFSTTDELNLGPASAAIAASRDASCSAALASAHASPAPGARRPSRQGARALLACDSGPFCVA